MPTDSIRSIIPDPVFRAISKHLVKAGHRAEDGFESVEEDEDSITGDFLRAIRKAWSKDEIVDRTKWRWRITTRKFRGRGELATEHFIGADGILQIELETPDGDTKRKGLLFQAKKEWRYRDRRLLDQVRLMEDTAPGGSAVFDYSAEAYRGYTPETILIGSGRPVDSDPKRLGEFLAEDFLGCRVGTSDVWYDWERKGLTLELPLGIRLTPKFIAAIQVVGTTAFVSDA